MDPLLAARTASATATDLGATGKVPQGGIPSVAPRFLIQLFQVESQSKPPLANHWSPLWCWVPLASKKSSVKSHDMSRTRPLDFPPFSPNQTTTTQGNEVALPHSESVTNLTKLCREFSRCLRPSLSSKRPLRARPVARRRPQSSSLNEISTIIPPSTKFTRLSLSPVSTRKGSREQRTRQSASEINRLYPCSACVHAYRDSNIPTKSPFPTLPDFRPPFWSFQLPITYTILFLHRQVYFKQLKTT